MPLFFLALALQCYFPAEVTLESVELVHPLPMTEQECADAATSPAIRASWLPVADGEREECEPVLVCVRMDASGK